ncbi:MAG: hypothetical protein K2X38_19185 [Gemmataceae bacterium]|nr:hypothetical protein [Gemmataceae bacterium]
MLFALGFLTLMLGLAMVVLGEMPISKTRRVPAKASRIAGGILALYFPLVLGIRYVWVTLDLDRFVAGNIVFAILWVLLAMAAGWIALRGAFPKKMRRAVPKMVEPAPFASELPASDDTVVPEMMTIEEPAFSFEAPAAKPTKAPAPAKKAPKKPAGGSPFDIS